MFVQTGLAKKFRVTRTLAAATAAFADTAVAALPILRPLPPLRPPLLLIFILPLLLLSTVAAAAAAAAATAAACC